MLNLSHEQRIANADIVLNGPHGAVTDCARKQGLSRQALYRDTQRLLKALQDYENPAQRQVLQDQIASLRSHLGEVQALLDNAILLDDDTLAAFVSTGQAEGVSLPVLRRLLAPVFAQPLAKDSAPKRRLPSVAQLGRWSRDAACRSAALLKVLDTVSRPRVEQAAPDEIFFGKKPCLMVVEQHSLCWVSGRLAERRDGVEWAKEFRQLPNLRQATQDGGTGLAKGLAVVNEERQKAQQAAVAIQDDHFHVLREGTRVLRKMQGAVTRALKEADKADRQAAKKKRPTGDDRGPEVTLAWQRAEQAMDAWSAATKTWEEVGKALRLFTPDGSLNTRAEATAVLEAATSRLTGPEWSKVRRQLQRPQLLTFLDKAHEGLASLPVAGELLQAAVRVEGLRRQPEATQGTTVSAGVRRGLLLVAGLTLSLSEEGAQVLRQVRKTLHGVWRASSLVECLNSVARMQQGRHRKMTQGLLDLKRLYWNCRAFRTGHRRKKSPYELQGLSLPTRDWWELLSLSPEELRQQLGIPNNTTTESPSQKVSGQEVAA
jgi:hypothetical protein